MNEAPQLSAEITSEILETWIKLRREILQREGCAVRAGWGRTIEVQIINSPLPRWLPIVLPDGTREFSTIAERDAVLARLQ